MEPVAETTDQGLSPHGRGKLAAEMERIRAEGSIPARAGETGAGGKSRRPEVVYPRTGGGTP